jgi:aspartyl-tRNA synthetase
MGFVFRNTKCGELSRDDVGKEVIIAGWVHRIRNLGSMLFIDLRDRFGITQIVCHEATTEKELFEKAKSIGNEYVIRVQGHVSLRQTPNVKVATGEIEVILKDLQVLSEAKVPPFSIADDSIEPSEDLRLTYRYLDMRRGPLLDNLLLRHELMQTARSSLSQQGFTEVSTPMLTKATPEGSRDYLVPSRVHHGHFYALPQSPQMFKQLLMIGGLDRYFQIATCCRDEDLRSDRQPEFHQIDIEMSFGTIDTLFPVVEKLVQDIFRVCKGIEIKTPFPRLSYRECMETYGSDKPDLRFKIPLVDCSDLASKTSFNAFKQVLEDGGIVRGLTVPKGLASGRKEIESYQHFVQSLGFAGLAHLKLQEGKLLGPIAKYIEEKDVAAWIDRFSLQEGEIAYILAGVKKKVLQGLDQLRRKLGRECSLIRSGVYVPLWVIDFPLFSWNEDEQKLESENHPFTSPNFDDLPLLETDPLAARSLGYDLVLNGYEVSSGSQRIHDSKLQKKIFDLLGYSQEETVKRFGFFIEALQYGTPPHLGAALGVDRLAMILCGTDNIRDVVAFPKNQKGVDLMTKAPSDVLREQLHELGIKLEQ